MDTPAREDELPSSPFYYDELELGVTRVQTVPDGSGEVEVRATNESPSGEKPSVPPWTSLMFRCPAMLAPQAGTYLSLTVRRGAQVPVDEEGVPPPEPAHTIHVR